MGFNGYPLLFVWGVEFLLILSIPIFIVHDSIPYSESLSKWYPKFTLNKDFESVALVKQLRDDLQTDIVQTLSNLGAGNGLRYTKVHVFYLKGNDQHYLTFEKIFIEGQGKGKKNSNVLINNFIIDTQTAKKILETYNYKRNRLEVL